jgi:hypothetical protein
MNAVPGAMSLGSADHRGSDQTAAAVVQILKHFAAVVVQLGSAAASCPLESERTLASVPRRRAAGT